MMAIEIDKHMIPDKLLFIFFLAIFPLSMAHAQTEKNLFRATFHPFSPLNPFAPRFRTGAVFGMGDERALGVELGYGHESTSFVFTNGDYPKEDYRLWSLGVEYFLLTEKSSTLDEYISVELYYINHSETLLNGRYNPTDANRVQFDRADYLRQKYGINLKVGIFAKVFKGCGVNLYGGVGPRIRNNRYDNVINPAEPNDLEENFVLFSEPIYTAYEKAGVALGVNLLIGAKIYFE